MFLDKLYLTFLVIFGVFFPSLSCIETFDTLFITLASIVPILCSGATRMFPYLISWFGGLCSYSYTLDYLHPLLKTLTRICILCSDLL